MDAAELESLSTRELHDRATSLARHRADLAFFWTLVRSIPAAASAAGHQGEADADIMSLSSLVADVIHSGEGDLGDALRPLYIDYLTKNS